MILCLGKHPRSTELWPMWACKDRSWGGYLALILSNNLAVLSELRFERLTQATTERKGEGEGGIRSESFMDSLPLWGITQEREELESTQAGAGGGWAVGSAADPRAGRLPEWQTPCGDRTVTLIFVQLCFELASLTCLLLDMSKTLHTESSQKY